MNEISGIKAVDFANPTVNPFVDSNDLRGVILERLAASQANASSNKAGAKLRADRATNTHLKILADIMEGMPAGFRADLSEGGSLSIHFGNRRIHIPTFNDYSRTVVQAGVRYAPLQHAVWDAGTKSTRIIGSEESLVNTLTGLMRSGIKEDGVAETASAIAASMEEFRQRGLMHLRFGPQAVGGALPYFLSNQVSVGPQHPATKAAMEVERLIGQAIKTMKTDVVLKKGELGLHGIQESASYVRQALAHQLAVGLILFQEGSAIKSAGVKALTLRGFDSFGGEREIGTEGRLIASLLPAHAYTAFPGEQLAKGLHHRRAVMAMPLQTIQQIRREGARLRGLKGPKTRASRLLMSAFDVEARNVASQHYEQMGVKLPGGVAQLDTPITGMFLRPKLGLSKADKGVADQLLTLMFGDSTVRPASPEMARLASEQSRYRVARLQGARASSYGAFDMHPVLEEAIRSVGVGGSTTLDRPITFEMLGGRAESTVGRAGRTYQRVTSKARLGGDLTSTGTLRRSRSGKIKGTYLRPDEEITGFRTGPGLTQVVIRRRGEVPMQEGTPILIGKKRVSLGTGITGFRSVDVVGPAGKLGVNLSSPDALVEHVANIVSRKGGKQGLKEVAEALGGQVHRRKIFGEAQIRLGDAELFPFGTDGAANLSKAKAVLDVAAKHGIIMGPASETERNALLKDIFEGGNTERIHELYRGLQINEGAERGLSQFLGSRGRAALGTRKIGDLLEAVRVTTSYAGRGGQPMRGTFGRVMLRMRDMRMYAVGTAALGGADIMSMYRKNAVLKAGFGLSGPQADQAAHSMRRYGRMWKNAVERPMGLEQYIEANIAAAEGRVERLGSEFEVISLEDYKKKYGSGVNRLGRRSELADLKGTPFVQEIDGQLVPTRKTLVVQMPKTGARSLSREISTDAAVVNHVVVPSGEALGLRQGEYINFTKLRRKGLKSSFGRSATRLHGALTGGDINSAYRVGGATYLTGAEHYLGRGGARHRGGSMLSASFGGTLVSDANIEVGEVGVSKKTAREMLRRQGWSGNDLEAKLRSVESGESEFFTHFKSEPMRAPEHITSAKVRIVQGQNIRGPGGTMTIKADNAIRVNPLGLMIRERDFDYDPGYLFNIAKKHAKKGLVDFHTEQTALQVLWSKSHEEHKAIADVAQQIIASASSKDASKKLQVHTAEMLNEARRIAASFVQGPLREGAHTIEHAMAQAQAAVPELLTPLANVRHRTRTQILEDVALGRDLSGLIMKHQTSEAEESLRAALTTLRNDIPALSWLHTTSKNAEYVVLKKKHAEMAFASADELAKSPDSFFSALSANLRIGSARPGTEDAAEQVSQIKSHLMDILNLDSDSAGASQVFSQARGITQDEIAQRMAVSYQAVAYLERQGVMSAWEPFLTNPNGTGTAIGPGGVDAMFLKLLEGRDPEFAQRISQGQNWGAITAGVSDAARRAGDEAVVSPRPIMSSFGKFFLEGSQELLSRLWKSKWGKFAVGGAGIIAAVSAGNSLFGGQGGESSPPGAPLPPPPLLGGPDDRGMELGDMTTSRDARVQRVPQVRTHYQVSGRMSGNMDFRGLGSAALGRTGRRPMHTGTVMDGETRQYLRNRIEAEVNDRMYSDF